MTNAQADYDIFKRKLNELYLSATTLIRTQKAGIESPANQNIKDKATLEIILNMFNNYEEVAQTYIHNLIEENSKLKASLFEVKSEMSIYKEKISVLIRDDLEYLNKIEYNHDINLETKKCEKVNSILIKSNHLKNLNQIRDLILDLKTKNRFYQDYFKKLKIREAKQKSSLIIQVPKWMPDDYVNMCMKCQSKFSIGRWKNHCRVCGNIFCSSCCNRFETFQPFYLDPVRMCESCFLDKKYEKYL